jgi:hypothetical protein
MVRRQRMGTKRLRAWLAPCQAWVTGLYVASVFAASPASTEAGGIQPA